MVKTDALESATDALVDELRTFSPLAQRTARNFSTTAGLPLSMAIELEGQNYGRLRSSDDYREGVIAFGEKRPPRFTGR